VALYRNLTWSCKFYIFVYIDDGCQNQSCPCFLSPLPWLRVLCRHDPTSIEMHASIKMTDGMSKLWVVNEWQPFFSAICLSSWVVSNKFSTWFVPTKWCHLHPIQMSYFWNELVLSISSQQWCKMNAFIIVDVISIYFVASWWLF